jgi:uncharacterized repeat protein (TIGR01451 family)
MTARAQILARRTLAVTLILAALLGGSVFAPLGDILHIGEAFAAGLQKSSGASPSVTLLRADDDSRPMIAAGQKFTLSIGVDNLRGGAAAQAAVLKVTLPPGLDLVQATPPAARTGASPEITWDLGTLKAGASPRIVEITLASADNLNANTNLTINATVATIDNGSQPKNSTSAYTVQIQPAAAALRIQSDLTGVAITVDAPVKFTAAVENLGTVDAAASALTLTLPPMVSFKSSDPAPSATMANVVTWQLGDIAAGESHAVVITVALNISLGAVASEPGPESLLQFKLDASTSTTGLDIGASHLVVNRHVELAGPNLKVWLSVQGAATPGELTVGKDVTYTIEYGNFGNAPAQHASVSLSLWEGLNFLGAKPVPTGTSKSDRFGGGVLSWDVGDLPVGRSSVIKSQIHVDSVPENGSLVMATITAPGADVNSSESTAYSLRHAAGLGGTTAGGEAWHDGHKMLWILVVLVLALGVVWVIRRARSKRAT